MPQGMAQATEPWRLAGGVGALLLATGLLGALAEPRRVEVEGRVLGVEAVAAEEVRLFRRVTVYRARVAYAWTVGGVAFERSRLVGRGRGTASEALDGWTVGAPVAVSYDAANPTSSVIGSGAAPYTAYPLGLGALLVVAAGVLRARR